MSIAAAAILSSGLLARKGAALPTSLAAVPLSPRAAIGDVPAPAGAAVPRRNAKVSLRLDPERHRKLRLAAVHLGRSGQRILIDALDAHLARCAETIAGGDCACLRRQPD